MQSPSIPLVMRRADAARYIREAHGIPCAMATLAKYACVGGGPSSARRASSRSIPATISTLGHAHASASLSNPPVPIHPAARRSPHRRKAIFRRDRPGAEAHRQESEECAGLGTTRKSLSGATGFRPCRAGRSPALGQGACSAWDGRKGTACFRNSIRSTAADGSRPRGKAGGL
jgi:hypothetical protein